MALGSAFVGSQGDTADYNKRVRAINAEADAVNKSLLFKYSLSQLQQQQVQDRATIEAADKNRDLRAAKGTAGAAAASSGIEGNSVEALLTSYDVATGNDLSNIFLQRDNEIAQSRAEMKGFEVDATNRLTSLKNNVPDDPSTKIMGRFLQAAFQTGGAYLQNTTKTPDGSGLFGRRFG